MNRYDLFTSTLTGMMPFAMVIALVIAYPLSLWLLGRYRAAVLKAMSENSELQGNRNPAGRAYGGNDTAPNQPVADLKPTPAFLPGLSNIMFSRPWLSGLIHIIAGIVFALLIGSIKLLSADISFSVTRVTMFFVVYFWPVALSFAIVATTTMRQQLLVLGSYFLFFFIVSAIAMSVSPKLSWGQVIKLWSATNLLPSVALVFLLNKQVRAVGPLVFVFLFISIMGALAFNSFVGATASLMKMVAAIMNKTGLGAGAMMLLLYITGFLLFALPGWSLLTMVKTRYKNKKTGDQSIILSTLWILFGFVYSMDFVWGNRYWVFAGFSTVIVYLLLTMFMERWLFAKYKLDEGASLLFLRVFALGKRSKNLFSRVSKYWRFNGSIQLISGPDLFDATLEPHEFFDFVTGKLARRFIHSAEDLAIRIAEMDKKPDRDGRYRVNDFFCYNDTWKMVLCSLVHQSRVILMDLRSFGQTNKGCQYEISELLNLVLFTHILFVTDQTTDQAFLKTTLEQSFNDLRADSPNKAYGYDQLWVFNFNKNNFSELLKELYLVPAAATVIEDLKANNGVYLAGQ